MMGRGGKIGRDIFRSGKKDGGWEMKRLVLAYE